MSQTTEYRNALALGAQLAEYRLESVLGAGGFGMTYLARDTHLDKLVAIKEYLPVDLAVRALDGSIVPVNTEAEHDYRWGLERFILEARTLARFSHPNIVRVNRYFEANGTGYMVMDYEEGESLSQRLRLDARPDEAGLKALLAPLLDGLHAVHAIGFLHRDIKPSNIFLRASGSPVLLDFGSARQTTGTTRSLTSVLTPGFAPLEQYASDGHQGPWSDIYAMGAVLYRAMVGQTPPDAVSRMRADMVPQSLDRVRDRYGEAFVAAVKWAMAVDEKMRPQSVDQWEPALLGARAALAGAPALEGAPTVPLARPATAAVEKMQRLDPPPQRKSGWRWVGIALVLVVAVAVAGAWNRQRAADARARQDAAQVEQAKLASALDAERQQAAETRARAEAELQRLQSEVNVPQIPAPPVDPRERPGREREARPADAMSPDVQRMRRAVEADFRSADANGDGYLSRDEAKGRFPLAARHFDRVDADRDGRISAQEFWEMRRAQIERRARQ